MRQIIVALLVGIVGMGTGMWGTQAAEEAAPAGTTPSTPAPAAPAGGGAAAGGACCKAGDQRQDPADVRFHRVGKDGGRPRACRREVTS